MALLFTGILLMFIAHMLLWENKVTETSEHFFDNSNTTVLRGFWSLIVILVHIPKSYQNILQELVGSFAYIGVTFFFMVSAYGLKKSVAVHGVNDFWKRRLSRLFVPIVIINIITAGIQFTVTGEVSMDSLPKIHPWVQWLLVCYSLFWLAYRFEKIAYKDTFVCIGIILFSIYRYAVFSGSGWHTEIYGFVWGILLANGVLFGKKAIIAPKWICSCIAFFVASIVLGLLYLRFKPIVFWGNYLLKIFLGLMLLCFMLCINKRISFGNKIGLWLGNISYEIYLTHIAVIERIFTLKKDWLPGTYIICVVVLTIILSTIENRISKFILRRLSCWRKS